MEKLKITTNRLIITEFDESMAVLVHLNSLDEDTRRFVPDEVFETVAEAREAILFLKQFYQTNNGPLVYPVLLPNGENIGYVQAVPMQKEWEIGYHIGKKYTCKGYATEALKAFVPVILQRLQIDRIWGICHADNVASLKVLEKCSFELQYKGKGNYQGQSTLICKYLYRLPSTMVIK
jgi:[ribosomal protein S5]-alanine N-acetyltransferase